MKSSLTKFLPEALKASIRRSSFWTRLSARKLARSTKRLDLCAAQIVHLLHLAGQKSLEGKVCLELGSGWVLSHALVLYLLGAEKVIAADLDPIAVPATLKKAVRGSAPYIVRDILSPFEEHDRIRSRLDRLLAVEEYSFDVLRELNIEYMAPRDLAKAPLGIPYDFALSLSVFEHVPTDDIAPLLKNLTRDLRKGGFMTHAIHLEDHDGIQNDPFGFLAAPLDKFPPAVQSERGNRLRKSQWEAVFAAIPDLETRFLYEWRRRDKKIPDTIDPSISYQDEDDLRTSHLGVFCEKTE